MEAVVFKLVPCICLAVFSSLLVRIMISTVRRRRRLRMAPDSHADVYRTAMLVAIALVYLLTEAPQGLMALATGLMVGLL